MAGKAAPATEIIVTEIVNPTIDAHDAHSQYLCNCRCLHIKTVALFAGLLSFALYIAVNAFFLIAFRLLAAYFALFIGTVFCVVFAYGYRQRNKWMVFIYFFFLGLFVAVLTAILSFSLAFLRDPENAPLSYMHAEFRFDHYYNTSDFYEKNPAILRHDIILYKVMFALSCSSLLITSVCIPIVYKFFKYICDCNSQLETSHLHRQRYNYHTRHTRHRVTPCNQRRNTATSDSICAISYPPPCPPAYEVEPTVHTPPRRPRRKANSSRSRLVLPQYTDFRPEVYAELPPYEEKPPIDGNE
uniref:Transmembrane protein n=1 Tax=Ascaris lumbricoides TaxID=6252 RepID=A0A0M3I878_ASCLU